MSGRVLPCVLGLVVGLIGGRAVADDLTSWTHYGGSQKGLQYSALDQITRANVDDLAVSWIHRTGELSEGMRTPLAFQANPILVEGRLYLPTPTAIVIALDPATGVEIWRHDPKMIRTMGTSEIANRGVSSWIDETAAPDAPCRHRIYVGTLDARLIALDGATGTPCADFGTGGEIDLNLHDERERENYLNYAVTSPPVIVDGVVIVGSSVGDNGRVRSERGIVRGLDARTGAERWRFDPIPRGAQDPEYANWKPEEAEANGSANAWAPLAADAALGLVYVPTGSASPDFYGGEREGDGRYANSVVALEAATGKVRWHQQLTHHDLWDYDTPAQPTLVELEHEGEIVPALLQATKTGMIFSFNRETGEPIFAIEERPVPGGGVVGEHLSPTQPFPVAPPPLISHAPVTTGDAWGMLLFDKWACADRFAALRSDGIYTPPGLGGIIESPGYAGGINWGGLAFDPERQIVVTNTNNIAMEVALIPRADFDRVKASGDYAGQQFATQRGTPYGMRRGEILSPLGVPCTAPPWGQLHAVDMRSGEILWQVPLGTIEDVAPAPVPNFEFGVPAMGGPILTASGLIFIGATVDDYIRAFDVRDGTEIWKHRLPAGGQATPMTYFDAETAKQYIVIAAGGHTHLGTTHGDYVVAFALP